jgi:hypothetical protein
VSDEPDGPLPGPPARSQFPRGRRPNRAVSGSFARSILEAAARGTGLIAVAVVIGVVLLQLSDDNTQPVAAGGEAVEVDQDSEAAVTTTTAAPTTTTTAAPMAEGPGEELATEEEAADKGVTVLVLNGSGRNKQAAPMSERLAAAGYQTLEPGNATLRKDSIVLCRPDHADAAGPLAAATGLGASTGTLKDDDFPDADDAQCVVIIGSG